MHIHVCLRQLIFSSVCVSCNVLCCIALGVSWSEYLYSLWAILLIMCSSCVHTARKSELGIAGFGISLTTMEEVFIKVGEGTDETLKHR